MSHRCTRRRLRRRSKHFELPTEMVYGAGQLNDFFLNGGYTLKINGKEFARLCLGKEYEGYNALVEVKKGNSTGRIWKDVDNIGCDDKFLAKSL